MRYSVHMCILRGSHHCVVKDDVMNHSCPSSEFGGKHSQSYNCFCVCHKLPQLSRPSPPRSSDCEVTCGTIETATDLLRVVSALTSNRSQSKYHSTISPPYYRQFTGTMHLLCYGRLALGVALPTIAVYMTPRGQESKEISPKAQEHMQKTE